MPTLFKMSDDKKTEDSCPAVVFTETPAAVPQRKTKKYVIIAVSGLLAAAIILTAILVGMYMFTEGQKEIIKYTLKLGESVKQDVTSDPNENIVQYHISNPTQESWIVNDFGKDLQLTKIKSDGETNCYVSPLNRTNTLDPAKINGPESPGSLDVKQAVSLTFRASDTPISDTSFLGKTAKEMCKGVSIYWLYPQCAGKDSRKDANMTELDHPRSKRQLVDRSPYYIYYDFEYYSPVTGLYYRIPCFIGCCRKFCAFSIKFTAAYDDGIMKCNWVYNTTVAVPYVWDECYIGPKGLICPTRRPAIPPIC